MLGAATGLYNLPLNEPTIVETYSRFLWSCLGIHVVILNRYKHLLVKLCLQTLPLHVKNRLGTTTNTKKCLKGVCLDIQKDTSTYRYFKQNPEHVWSVNQLYNMHLHDCDARSFACTDVSSIARLLLYPLHSDQFNKHTVVNQFPTIHVQSDATYNDGVI